MSSCKPRTCQSRRDVISLLNVENCMGQVFEPFAYVSLVILYHVFFRGRPSLLYYALRFGSPGWHGLWPPPSSSFRRWGNRTRSRGRCYPRLLRLMWHTFPRARGLFGRTHLRSGDPKLPGSFGDAGAATSPGGPRWFWWSSAQWTRSTTTVPARHNMSIGCRATYPK